MGILTKMGDGQGYLKAGFLGFAGSGKTHTALVLAVGLRKHLGLTGPIAMFDTEGGSEYWGPRIKEATGLDLIGVRSRALSDLMAAGAECEASGVSVLVVDSITHVWREVQQSYLDQMNRLLKIKGREPRTRLEFQDHAKIQERWSVWPDFYLNSKLHIAIAGRAGYEWDFEEKTDERGNIHKELVKTGTKMKVQNEFGFEPSLLVEMERIQIRDEDGKLTKAFVRRATVLKDRFAILDGATCDNPGYEFFKPFVDQLVPGAHAPVDTALKTDYGMDEEGDDAFNRERKLRVILCEKVQAALLERWPGQTKEDKQAKVAALRAAFGTTSWTEVETKLDAETLKRGLASIEGMPIAGVEVA